MDYPQVTAPVHRHLEFPGTFRTRDARFFPSGQQSLVEEKPFLLIYLCPCKHLPRKRGSWACASPAGPRAAVRATGKSHVITVESTYATILSPGMYTLSLCPAALSQSSRKLRKRLQHKQIQNPPGTNHLPTAAKAWVYGFTWS